VCEYECERKRANNWGPDWLVWRKAGKEDTKFQAHGKLGDWEKVA